jgi:hypothetical protein
MYEITLFEGDSAANSRVGQSVTADFNDVANLITQFLWAPGLFQNDTRSNANLKSIGLLVLDIDNGCSLSDGVKLFSKYKHVIGTSRSHGIEKKGVVADRFRVVLFLETPASSDSEFKEHWFAAFAKWPFIDQACKDSARFFFPCKEIVSVNEDGELFSERSFQITAAQMPRQDHGGATRKGKLSKATKDFLIEGAAPGEWHGKFIKAAIDFKEQGFDIDEARLKLTAVTGHLDETDEQQLEDVYNNRPSKYAPRVPDLVVTDWPVLALDKYGKPMEGKPSSNAPENYRHLIRELKMNFAYNEIDGNIYVNGKVWEEPEFLSLWIQGKDVGMHGSKDLAYATVMGMAQEQSYNPIKDAIESAPWDGKVDYIEELFQTLTFALGEDVDLYRKFVKKWLVAVVAKLYSPGQQNLVLTFVGAQGIGKSRWLSKLALWPNAFGEGAIDPTNKDHELRHLTHLIWHIPELDYTTGKRETGALKDYLTRDFVNVRPAYARLTRQGRSICSFAASVNAEEFLVDPTGNRRYLVIAIEAINHVHTVNMQQVFAQAKTLLNQGYEYWLNDAGIKDLSQHNERFLMQDTLSALAATVQPGSDRLTILELMSELDYMNPTRADVTRLGILLAKNGIEKSREQVAGVRKKVFHVKSPKGSKGLRVIKPL